VVAVLILAGSGLVYRNFMTAKIDPAKYTPLLNTIAKGESNGNYNAYFGNANNSTVIFTEMTVDDVLKWQEDFVKQGHASSAVGKYQIINTTLKGLVRQMDIDTSARFDEAMQDRMAVALLERRGSEDYVNKKLTREQFAANLAKEWAALPRVIGAHPEQSYYAGDGLNKVQISIEDIFKALAALES
jgi:muramidase (phage lysozyme)